MVLTTRGPKVRAGLSAPPVRGPINRIAAATARPIMSPAQPPGARLSTASAMIAVTSRNVPIASATIAWM